MKKSSYLWFAAAGAAALVALAGCAQKEETKATPTPVALAPVATPTEVPSIPTDASANHQYVVKRGDSLWKIAGNPDVMGDSFRWPLLFKSNRDQIVDPDLIQPDQDLNYSSQYSQDQVDEAVQKAKETPAYRPHANPRSRLPVNY